MSNRKEPKAKLNQIIPLGFDNLALSRRVIAAVSAQTKPTERLSGSGRKLNKLIDATAGRKTRCAIITDSDQVILSSLQPQTLMTRLNSWQE